MWIARDEDGRLWVYNNRPIQEKGKFVVSGMRGWDLIEINKEEFPEITWENSPKEITTTIKTKK